ncbi:MAG: RNA repair transcriptional activator RtcR family protein, partial [Chthoniobacteraceae bacterium]
MAAKKKCVLIGLLGTNLDRGVGPERWESWRPSVSLCQQDDLLIHRFELISQQKFTKLAEIVASDLAQVSPETEVRHASVEVSDWWDFEEVYGALLDFAQEYPF